MIRPSLFALLVLGGCLSSNPPLEVRWFTPALAAPQPVDGDRPQRPIALAEVTTALHIGEPMIWRRSDVEFAFDERARWLSRPETLARRALRTALGDAGFELSNALDVPSLRVRLSRFEANASPLQATVGIDVLYAPAARGSELTNSFSVSESMANDSPEAYARAVGRALDRAARDAAAWVATIRRE